MANFYVILGAIVLAAGTALSIAASVLAGKAQDRSMTLLSGLPVPAAPRQLFGVGNPAASPVYGIMWATIYSASMLCSLFLLVAGISGSIISKAHEDDLFNGAACVASAFIVTCVWPMTFRLSNLPRDGRHLVWPLWMSVTIVVVAGLLGLWGLVIYQPSLKGELAVTLLVGLPWSFFVGWLLIAVSVGVSIGYTAENHSGFDEFKPSHEQNTWFGPLIATGAIAILAGSLGEPGLSVPGVAYVLFLKIDWRHGLALGAAVLGVIGGLVRISFS
jgi:hypothetical protein